MLMLMTKDDYIQLQQALIASVLQKKVHLHQKYEYLLDKLSLSNKSQIYKLILSKRLLSRLIRESNKILDDAQKCSSKYCYCCDNEDDDMSIKQNNSMWLH
tara:strand:- start:905 stop:1207 length:303 start_codon:yes stop_codon:yes gene_type:complete